MRPDGIVLRQAHEQDLDQIDALLVARGDAADGLDARLVAADADEGLASIAVAVDGDRVVSTATLLRETVVVEGTALPAGQVELVATDPAYEGRGLVRALMGWAHDRSAARGDVLQVMIGIPFFYRQFGYSYCIPIPPPRAVATVPAADPTIGVRVATAADIPAMAELQDAAQACSAVRMPHSAGCWRWLVARDGSVQLIATREGAVVGTGRMTPPHEGVFLGELAGDVAAVGALVAHAAGDGDAWVVERPRAPWWSAIEPSLAPIERAAAMQESYYARIPRVGPLLEALRPVLERRFAAGGLVERHDVLLSSWRSHVRFTIGPDGMGPVVEGGPEQAPGAKGGSGVAPDVVPALVLGPHGAIGLEERHPDVRLGRQRELMAALFPPVEADLLTFFLPL